MERRFSRGHQRQRRSRTPEPTVPLHSALTGPQSLRAHARVSLRRTVLPPNRTTEGKHKAAEEPTDRRHRDDISRGPSLRSVRGQ